VDRGVAGACRLLLIAIAVREPESPQPASGPRNPLTLSDAKELPLRYWLVVALGFVPAIMIVMNIVCALFAYPGGAAADRFSARTLLVFGLGVLVAADVLLAMAESPPIAFLGAAFWGLHMAFTQGLLSKLVADTAPVKLRGTAFGIFNLVSGGALLLASVVAGTLWSVFEASATFVAGGCFAALAATGLILFRPKARPAAYNTGG